eukprot:210338_1
MKSIDIFIITYVLLFGFCHSYSSCDDIDIHFLIDIDSVFNNGNSVEHFIKSIIWNSSSEQAGFSILLYGDNMPINISSIIITNLKETHSIYQRERQQNEILFKLQSSFNVLKSNPIKKVKRFALKEAFNMSITQNKPERIYKKK